MTIPLQFVSLYSGQEVNICNFESNDILHFTESRGLSAHSQFLSLDQTAEYAVISDHGASSCSALQWKLTFRHVYTIDGEIFGVTE